MGKLIRVRREKEAGVEVGIRTIGLDLEGTGSVSFVLLVWTVRFCGRGGCRRRRLGCSGILVGWCG